MAQFGIADRRVELDQHIARLDCLAILHVNGADGADLERLHDLTAAARYDFALRGGDDVDLAEARPGEGGAKGRDHGQRNGAADRRRRRLDDFECGRQKRHAVDRPQPPRRGGRRQRDGGEGGTREAGGRGVADGRRPEIFSGACLSDEFMDPRLEAVEGGVAASGADQLVMAAVLDEPAALDG